MLRGPKNSRGAPLGTATVGCRTTVVLLALREADDVALSIFLTVLLETTLSLKSVWRNHLKIPIPPWGRHCLAWKTSRAVLCFFLGRCKRDGGDAHLLTALEPLSAYLIANTQTKLSASYKSNKPPVLRSQKVMKCLNGV